MSAKDSNSGPHVHTLTQASALPPQPLPQPRAGYELIRFLNAFLRVTQNWKNLVITGTLKN